LALFAILFAGLGWAGVPIVGPAFDAQYRAITKFAGGRWHCLVSDLGSGKPVAVVEEDADFVIEGASVQKLAVMTAVMSEVDAGRLRMSDTTTLDADIVAEGSGLYLNQAAFGDQLTVANLMTTMLQVSDNTAVRLMSRFVSGDRINETLEGLGFKETRVVPIAGDSRFYLGYTTPRENNELLCRLASGTLLSSQSTRDVLRIMSWSAVGYTDGVRRNMSSDERARFATKHGASEDKRHDTGIMFDAAGAPLMVFSFFADQAPDPDNYGATNPIVEAHATLGRALLDTYTQLSPLQSFIDPKKISAGGH
ncbi:serine hydrolase, partial [Nocardia seriolae]|uniref:serine hydrolase n=1 Tax=Nocardia seriolae TaxID=37332 RepID=UPI0012BC88B3